MRVLSINSGSSSVKFDWYDGDQSQFQKRVSGKVDGIGSHADIHATFVDSGAEYFHTGKVTNHEDALKESIHALQYFLPGETVSQVDRIGMIATLYGITHGDTALTYECARVLLGDTEDLLHKAVGWMLREAGKRVSEKELIGFLDETAPLMPRTMLRYAIERLPKNEKLRIIKMPSIVTRRRRI